jgi:hypothetical protein
MKKIILISGFIVLNIFLCFAQEVKFTATLQKNPVVQGERFQITFTLHNAQGIRFSPPGFSGFTTLMGPSTSQSTQWINGQVSQQTSYTYVLQANKKGNYQIGPATITVNGKPIQSNSVTVNVVEPDEAEKQRRQQAKQEEKSLSQQAQDVIGKNLFVKVSINKNNVYQGEEIIATYKIYVHPDLNVRNLAPKKEPSFNGFWAQQLDLGNIDFQNERLNGVLFRSAVIKKVILFPQRSGKLEIEPYSFDCVARLRVEGQQRRRRSLFDDFFDEPFFGGSNYRDFSYVASSKKLYINVKALPQPQPEDFFGAVGNINMEAWIDKTSTKTGEPISLNVKVSGTGNLKLIEPLDLNLPPDFELYDPKIADNLTITATGIKGNKIFEYLMIPKHEGEYKIEPVHFSYFDLSKKQYLNLKSDEFIIKVGKGDGSESTKVSGIKKEDIQFLGKDIRFIKTETEITDNKSEIYGSAKFYILSLAPLFLFLFFIFYKRKHDEISGNQMLLKNKRATKVAKKRLVNAKKYLNLKDRNRFFEEIEHALWGYISDKLGIPVSVLTKESATKALSKIKIPDELIEYYLGTIDNSEFRRYAPSTEESGMEKIYQDAVDVITKLEGRLK